MIGLTGTRRVLLNGNQKDTLIAEIICCDLGMPQGALILQLGAQLILFCVEDGLDTCGLHSEWVHGANFLAWIIP